MTPGVKKKFEMEGIRYLTFLLWCMWGLLLVQRNSAIPQPAACDKSRKVFNTSWGVITDGPSGLNYTQDSHCEWLVRANNSRQFITLTFHAMGTECSYDYVFVYDGDSFKAPLLGSFSGKTEPQQVTAASGSMLILLYSDTNYVLDGFRAEFFVSDCPGNCSGHGMCTKPFCVCDEGWGGKDCGRELCPERCGNGSCSLGRRCLCPPGYSGEACSLQRADNVGNSWHWLSRSHTGLSARAAHSAVYLSDSDSLYVFGGYDLNRVLGDLVIYRFNSSTWQDEEGNVLDEDSTTQLENPKQFLNDILEQVGERRWDSLRRNFLGNILFAVADNSTQLTAPTGSTSAGPSHLLRLGRPPRPRTRRAAEAGAGAAGAQRPAPRYGHAACSCRGGFVLYGGKLRNGSLSDELWLYDVSARTWQLRAQQSRLRPPPLTRHTLTRARGDSLYLFGGSTVGGEFSPRLFRIRLAAGGLPTEQWEEVRPRGGKQLDVRVVAHSTVFHPRTNSLLVYGGVLASVARFSKLSDRLFSFHLDGAHWSELRYPRTHLRDSYVPRERAFHTSAVIGNYLVVFGGYSHRHNKEEICYDNQLYLYHLGCHTWVSHEVLGGAGRGRHLRYPKQQGVFAHAADVRNGNTLLLVGGYHGNVNADLLAYVLPPMLASRTGQLFEPEHVCNRHRSLMECTANPECGWCSADEVCYGRTAGTNCTTNLQTTRCPGVCPALGDCHSCLIHGRGARGGAGGRPPSVASRLRLDHCTWCVQNARCNYKDDNFGVCGFREDSPSQAPGWWGPKGTEVVRVDECRLLDRRPGLTFIKYRHPANFSHPDSVSIINATTVDFNLLSQASRTEQALGGEMIARLLGFLRPPEAWGGRREALRMCASHASTLLRLARTDKEADMEVVANLSAYVTQTQCVGARWPSGEPALLQPGRYLLDFQSHPAINFMTHQQSKMELQHNRSAHDSAKVFTFEYLEPYENGSCHRYSNCLHCLTDSLCGWCSLQGRCLSRRQDEVTACTAPSDPASWHFLTLLPAECDNCSNYITCASCLGSGLCEWWAEDARCARRGRFSDALVAAEQCPRPCHLRANCSECLDAGRCVWCEATQECFSFSVYTSEYQFGLCREWVDQAHAGPGSSGASGRLAGAGGAGAGAGQCKACGRLANCSSCLRTLGCGWCFRTDSPIEGVCVPGDFTQPQDAECSLALSAAHNASVAPQEASWAYAECPDVDECSLDLDNCHEFADCTNTRGSFSCQCRRGYYGDGINTCEKTCFSKCVHGYCMGKPHYACKCDLGWTGEDCSVSCGCHNHSTCREGVGLCDQCHDWTEGDSCERCKPGSFGNATTAQGCRACNCNEHGDVAQGVCDVHSGACFCKDNTEGDSCERCQKGYYGDPRHGGTCYYQCMARGMLYGEQPQGLGSRLGQQTPWQLRPASPPTRECLWVVSPSGPQDPAPAPAPATPTASTDRASSIIQLTLHDDINISCQENSVYVYDGLPDFVSASSGHQSHVLGIFCSMDTDYPVTVEAKSGVLTVYYRQGDSSEGFNASYSVLRCPHACSGQHVCRSSQCVCREGFAGPNCSVALCPGNCSAEHKQGACDKAYGRCLCAPGYGGDDCSVALREGQLVFARLFDSTAVSDSLEHLRKTLPRFGHSLAADRRSLWMFGGFSLSHGPLNDIRLFDTKNNTWMPVTVDSTRDINMPRGRYFHGAEYVPSLQEMYVYGGLTDKEASVVGLGNNTLNDFWKFNLKNQRWTDIPFKHRRRRSAPPLAGHTLTLRREGDSMTLVLIGGFSPKYGFLDTVWEYDVATGTWDTLNVTGYGPLGVYGHSTVYHSPSQSFYVFGGYLYGINRTFISNKLFAFHYPSRTWALLPSFEEHNPADEQLPRARFLHSAVSTDGYMLVFGGRSYPQNSSDSLVAYSYACNQWVRLISSDVPLVGSAPPHTFSQAMALDDAGQLYIVGGLAGAVHCHVTRVSLPSDLCALWRDKDRCRSLLGCSFCGVFPDGPSGAEANASYCYSSQHERFDKCEGQQGTIVSNNGVQCNASWLAQRRCEQFSSCGACLAQWPGAAPDTQACQWCVGCGRARCVPAAAECASAESRCSGSPQLSVRAAAQCPERRCAASDCDKCQAATGPCVWTRQVLRTVDQGVQVMQEPLFDWDCVATDARGRPAQGACPARCSELTTCRSCLQAAGAEGGWHACRWSVSLNECISPSYQPLYCAGGVCGLVLRETNIGRCPEPCSSFHQCSTCLHHAYCGWCSVDTGNGTGYGICIDGTNETSASLCQERYSRQQAAAGPSTAVATAEDATGEVAVASPPPTFSYHYFSCPPENECLNGHHTCEERSEQCVDEPDGYRCQCGRGYRADRGGVCVPVCSQGCVRGVCTEPDTCKCDFGYVGANCSIQCQCNGHSDCAGPDKLDVCIGCQNNTLGPQCQRCKPMFVGDPSNGRECVPCSDHCHGHTSICVSDSPNSSSPTSSELPKSAFHEDGPTGQARCVACGNLTAGERCEKCIQGNFRINPDPKYPCRPCECHGHGDVCDPNTGEGCNCQNNTESDPTCSAHSKGAAGAGGGPGGGQGGHCWMHQCSRCRELYSGTPTHGHQCYRHMTVDSKFCFDSKQLEDCKSKPKPLYPGQSVFFVVQPRFMNVDIRVIVDVTQGALDLFLSPLDDTFVVSTNSSSGAHKVDLDPRYQQRSAEQLTPGSDAHEKTSILELAAPGPDGPTNGSGLGLGLGLGLGRPQPSAAYVLRERRAHPLTTFVTVSDRHMLVIVRGLRDRLVLTIPQDRHELGSTKFYLALTAVGAPGDDSAHFHSYGMVFFRQDQLHIDLFVFFSVFFSCFFLFLAACVVAWKAKQAADVRRARRRHVVEMLHMAKRPFATVTLLLEPSCTDDCEPVPALAAIPHAAACSPQSPLRKKVRNRLGPGTGGGTGGALGSGGMAAGAAGVDVRPVAVEPTEDGVAAVATVLIRLPGGGQAPVRLALASSLILLARVYPAGPRAFLRRRSSHAPS